MSTNPFFENISFSRSFTDQVKFIVKDLFFNTGIKYFIYLRGSLDGSVSALFSHGDFFLDLLEKGLPISLGFGKEYKSLQTYSYWWNDKYPKEVIALAQKHGLGSGFSLVRRYHDYFEMFGFADSNIAPLTASSYISCLSGFETFSDHFVRVGKNIIKQVIEHPLLIPSHQNFHNPQEICLGGVKGQYLTKGISGETYLTALEFFSLQLFLKGKSYKEIGRILSVSHKTVEKYLSNVKRKTGYYPRDITFLFESDGQVNLTLGMNEIPEIVV